ncbi:MAG TPA: hypothetical protein VEP48_02105 [Methylomirabilota bacterium]|nr:hypothetical protein [Methylomirabilota bacterium]
MDSGLYITFFTKDEPHDRDLPPVGPLDQVVLRHRQLVADRKAAQQSQDPGVSIDRWLEAELELQRATGEEPGGTKRSDIRVTAPDGVFVRFAVFGDVRERDPMTEVGPFAIVVVGPRSVEGDGQQLASRSAGDLATWELTSGAGGDFAGLHKPDIAFRNATGAYHRSIAPAATPRTTQVDAAFAPAPLHPEPPFSAAASRYAEPAVTPIPRNEPLFVPPREEFLNAPTTEPLFKPREEHAYAATPPRPARPTEEVSALTSSDIELIARIERERAEETLRARVQDEERRRLGVDEAAGDSASTWAMRYRPQEANPQDTADAQGGGLTLGALLWRMRIAIIGVLLVGVAAYGFAAITTGTAPNVAGVQQFSYVGVGTRIIGTRWDWIVNGVQRVATAGDSKPRGIYYLVRVGATNKGTEGAQLAPNDFVLVDPNGIEHTALGLGSGVYQGPSNVGSSNVWPREFPVGKTVNFSVVFDIEPSLGRGMVFGITDVPKTRVRLD